VEPSRAIAAAELEWMMKVQDLILKALATKMSWLRAARSSGERSDHEAMARVIANTDVTFSS
jgi:hypothetical protein